MEIKKNTEVDLRKMSGLFMNIGLVISLSLVLLAFEYKSYNNGSLMALAEVNDDFEEIMEIPPTEQPPPPPPKIQQPEIIEVPDEEEIEDQIEVDLDIDITDETIIEEAIFEDPEEEEIADEIFLIAEKMPVYPGGLKALYKTFKKMKYPPRAHRMGIQGKVILSFVIDTDGSVIDISILRGLGGGCNEEAIRMLKNLRKWSPGKQRGIPVKVRMNLPITFRLS